MVLVVVGLTVLLLVAVYVVRKPRREPQPEKLWRAAVERLPGLQGNWRPSSGAFQAFEVPLGPTRVTAVVTEYVPGEWKTVVRAEVRPGRAPTAFLVEPGRGGIPVGDLAFQTRHRVTALLGTPPGAIRPRFGASVCKAFGLLGGGYRMLAVDPSVVSLELPGVCSDPEVLEAALRVVGEIARA